MRVRAASVAVVLLLVWPCFIAAQFGPGADDRGEEPEPLVTIGSRILRVSAGQEAEVVVVAPQVPADDLSVVEPDLGPAVRMVGNPEIVSRGAFAREIRFRFVSQDPGYHRIGRLQVYDGRETRSTEPLLLAAENRTGRIPHRVRWSLPPEPVYVGQSVAVLLEIADIDSLAYPESLTFRAPASGLFEEVAGLGSVEVTSLAGLDLYRIPVAGFIFTAAADGAIQFPSASIGVLGVEVNGPPATLEVLPLPSAAREAHALGDFSLSTTVSTSRLAGGESGAIELQVAGFGNLPVLRFPEVRLTGLVEIDRDEQSVIEPDRTTGRGYRGERRLTIRFEPALDGADASIRVAPFVAFDPATGETARFAARNIPIDVVAVDGDDPVRPRPDLELVSLQELSRAWWYTLDAAPIVWFAFLLGPLGFAVYRLATVGRGAHRAGLVVVVAVPLLVSWALPGRLDRARLARAAELAEAGRPAVAGVLYDLELQRHPWHAGLHYNRGVLALSSEDPVSTVFHLRRAARLVPASHSFRAALEQAERYFGVEPGTPIPRLPRPISMVLLVALLWSGLWVILSARPSAFRSMALISVAILTVAGIVLFGVAQRTASVTSGVIVTDVSVRRIPESDATEWVRLSAATPVEVELSYGRFYLIRTAGGVSGWIPRQSLWSAGER